MAKLTVVDFSNKDCFKPGTSSWLSIRKDICHALEELDCFVAKLPDRIPSEIRSPFFGTLDELFDFPTKTKLQRCSLAILRKPKTGLFCQVYASLSLTIEPSKPIHTMAKLTVVDFYDKDCFKPGTSSWLSIRKDICYALEELGCFVAKLPGIIPSEIRSDFFDTLDDLFDFPTETKLQITYEKPFPIGYIPYSAATECITIGCATNPKETKKFTHHFWPNGNDQFRQGADSYVKVMEKLDHAVTRMVFENYGVEKYHDDHIRSVVYLYKFSKYNDPEKTGMDVGIQGHTDKDFSTVLYQNHVKGLEIKSKDDEWISFDPVPSSFIYIAGDGFKVWSNDRIQTCKHRVTLRENDVRYSLALFSYKEGETCVPNELVDKDHPLKYKPLHLLEYVQYFMKNYRTLGPNFSIKTYCGV